MKCSNIVILLGCCIGLGQVKLSLGLLRCYSCTYDEGDPNSSRTCEHNPTSAEQGDFDVSQYTYCYTRTGLRNGKKYVRRGSLDSTVPRPDKVCDDSQPGNVEPIDYPRTCRCHGPLCNVGDWDSAAIGGITCYRCTYIEGDPSSSATCANVPADTETVFAPGHPGFESSRSTSNNHTTDRVLSQVPGTENDYTATDEATGLSLSYSFPSKLGGKARSPNGLYTYCYIQMGQLNGRKYVGRNALDSDFVQADNSCEDRNYGNLPLTNPKACVCTTKNCNFGDWEFGKPTPSPPTTTTTTIRTTTTTTTPTTTTTTPTTTTTTTTTPTTTTTTRRTTTTKRTTTPRPPTTPEEEEEDLCPTEDPVTDTPGEGTTESNGGNSTTENPDVKSTTTRTSRRRLSRAKCGAGDVGLNAILVFAGLIFAWHFKN